MRAAVGAAAAGVVVLTATGGTPLGPEASTAAPVSAREVTAQQVAQVWRSAGQDGAVPREQPADPALAAELAVERAGTSSRSEDRLSATRPSEGRAPAAAPVPPADDPVAEARQRVEELLVQQAADDVDAERASGAATASAAQARAAVEAAEQQRAAEAAAAELAAAQADPRSVAAPLVAARGWGAEQFACLDRLWTKESGWKWWADNPTSSAYGIPQSLPGEKMASHGEGWREDPRVQVAWGVDYIADAYGTPCRAWAHSQAVDWY